MSSNTATTAAIDAAGLHYRELNERVRSARILHVAPWRTYGSGNEGRGMCLGGDHASMAGAPWHCDPVVRSGNLSL